MRLLKALVTAAAVLGGSAATAQQMPVVVELFTSQGCSACPPADAFMQDLAKEPGVLALALHVDYWDYIGWKDQFAQPQFTARQKAYARAAGQRSVYTPQMIVDGQDHVVGTHIADVVRLLRSHAERPRNLAISVARQGGDLQIELRPTGPLSGAMAVQLVRYRPDAVVDIARGENAGKRVHYVNIVSDWTLLSEWDGRTPLAISQPISGDLPAAVIVQSITAKGPGRIEAAALLP